MDIKDKHQTKEPVHTPGETRLYIGLYFGIAAVAAVLYVLLRSHVLPVYGQTGRIAGKVVLACAIICCILAGTHLAEKLLRRRVKGRAGHYNLIRAIRLLTMVVVVFVIISIVNANWYAAAVSLGLISLILGFALQTPIASLIGWFYIILRTPYRVGDRIQVGSFTGDVVEIQYLDTTLWEFAGNYMTNDLPSGRLIRFPNSLIFTSEVYNYSWQKFPYIWNEIPFHVAYESDLDFIERRIREIATEVLGTEMEEKVDQLRQVIRETPVDEVQIKEYPFVHFRINSNTWVEVLLVYLVAPKHSGSVRSQLIKRILAELMASPEKAMFPKTNSR